MGVKGVGDSRDQHIRHLVLAYCKIEIGAFGGS